MNDIKTKRYVVAPGITADLCDKCWLKTINPQRDMTELERSRRHLSHMTYTAIVPHPMPTERAITAGRSWPALKESKCFDIETLNSSPLFDRRLF